MIVIPMFFLAIWLLGVLTGMWLAYLLAAIWNHFPKWSFFIIPGAVVLFILHSLVLTQ